MADHAPEPKPVAVCAICREPITKAKEALVTETSVVHLTCIEKKTEAA